MGSQEAGQRNAWATEAVGKYVTCTGGLAGKLQQSKAGMGVGMGEWA